MKKITVPVSNHFCPQTLFLFGTYREDGSANFGLFCWVSYCWDGELCVMACIGEDKPTRERIRQTGVFSMNLVTRELLPFADFCGSNSGRSEKKQKAVAAAETVRGSALNVPLLALSPWSYELQVARTIPLNGGGELYICKIRNIMADETLADESASVEERIHRINPAATTHATYFDFHGERQGAWGDWKEKAGT